MLAEDRYGEQRGAARVSAPKTKHAVCLARVVCDISHGDELTSWAVARRWRPGLTLPLAAPYRSLTRMSVSSTGLRESDLPEHLRAALSHYASQLRARLGRRLRGLSLFGSWARGQAHANIDVDVWVLVDVLDPLTRHAPFEVAQETLFEHAVDLAPTVMGDAEWHLLSSRERRIAKDIQREGIPL
jgi:predicted nucleotidyltransferase